MSEQRHSATGVYITIAVLVFLPPLYVLSVGPVVWVLNSIGVEHNDWIGRIAQVFYWPLLWLIENSEVAEDWLKWYLGFWGEA